MVKLQKRVSRLMRFKISTQNILVTTARRIFLTSLREENSGKFSKNYMKSWLETKSTLEVKDHYKWFTP